MLVVILPPYPGFPLLTIVAMLLHCSLAVNAYVITKFPYFTEEVYNQKRLHSVLDYRSPNDFGWISAVVACLSVLEEISDVCSSSSTELIKGNLSSFLQADLEWG